MTKYRFVCRTILLSALVTITGYQDAAAATPPAYRVTDLGTLGGTISYGLGINDSGHVTGASYATGDVAERAFFYDGMMMHDLGTLGGSNSSGTDINASGQVIGVSDTADDGLYRAFLYDGVMHDLGTLGGSYGFGINDSGHMTGRADTFGGGNIAQRAFLYDGAMHDLGTLGGGTNSIGRDINASGQVTGSADTVVVGSFHAFLWTPTTPNGATGTIQDLGTLGGSSEGRGINDSGQVTGWSETTAGLRAFLYDGTMHDLGTLGGFSSEGYDINASGHVTGYSYTTGDVPHAFLYTSGSGMADLNSLIDPLSGWELQFGYGINDSRQITGFGLIGGETHAFLLTPVPEPVSIALLALGLPFLLSRRAAQRS